MHSALPARPPPLVSLLKFDRIAKKKKKILRAQMQTVEDKTVIGGLRWYASDRYGLLITVCGVGGDFSQTGQWATGIKVIFHQSLKTSRDAGTGKRGQGDINMLLLPACLCKHFAEVSINDLLKY